MSLQDRDMQASHIMDNGVDTEEAQKQKVTRKRIAIAAEALSSASDVKIPNIPKTEAVLRVLGMVLMQSRARCLFSHCLAMGESSKRLCCSAYQDDESCLQHRPKSG